MSKFGLNARAAVSTLIACFEPGEDLEKYLVLKHVRGTWELPGGKLEPGETLSENAKREVEEETGFKITLGPITSVFSNGTDDGNTFIFVIFNSMILPNEDGKPPEPELSGEHTEYMWLNWFELQKLENMAPRLKALTERISRVAVWDRDVTDDMYDHWYPGERPEVGKSTST